MLVLEPEGVAATLRGLRLPGHLFPQTLVRRSAPLLSETIPVDDHIALTSH